MFNPFSKKAKDANILKKEFVYLNLYMLVSDKDFGADLMPTLKLILKNKKDMVFEIPGTITEEREDQTIKNHICGATVKMNALNFLNRKDEINEKINNFIDSLPKDMKYDFFISIGIENNAINETSLKILTEASSEFDFLTNQEEKDSNIRIFDSEIRVNNYTIKVKDKIRILKNKLNETKYLKTVLIPHSVMQRYESILTMQLTIETIKTFSG